jgi:hypothetical protein
LSMLKPLTTCEAALYVFMLRHSVLLLTAMCSLASAAVWGYAGEMPLSGVARREVVRLRCTGLNTNFIKHKQLCIHKSCHHTSC